MTVYIIMDKQGKMKIGGFNCPYSFLDEETANRFARNFLGKDNYTIEKYSLTKI